MRTFAVTTLGCKVNQYETAQFAAALSRLGLTPTGKGQTPDLCLVHTCAVTVEAMRKSRQAVRAAGGTDHTRVVVTGCWATAHSQQAARLPDVALVIPNRHHAGAVETLTRWVRQQGADPSAGSGSPREASGDGLEREVQCGNEATTAAAAGLGLVGDDRFIMPGTPSASGIGRGQRPATSSYFNIRTTPLTVKDKLPPRGNRVDAQPVCDDESRLSLPPLGRFSNRCRAFVKVQDGCDAFCTFCIIPQLRANLHSRPVDEIVAEVRSLVEYGHREVVLTGIFMGAFGRPTALRRRWDPDAPQPLVELVDRVSRVDGLARLRLSSLEPGDLTAELLDLLADRPNCVPHLHLPLQSGSDAVLRRMNRQYGRSDYEAMIAMVHDRLDRPAISTDIIVGFPGETEADFAATLDAARSAGFVKIHAFRYSTRPGTAAARWRDRFVDPHEVKARMARLRDLEAELSLAYRRRFEDETVRVLVEAPNPRTPALARGRCDRYFMVYFDAAGSRGHEGGIRDQLNPKSEIQNPKSVHSSLDTLPPPGSLATVRITRVTPRRTHGALISIDG